nr:hypothetical protein BaRGS_023543 [Batillaria attramentaria]
MFTEADELERLEKNNEKKPEKCATHKTEIALFVCAQCDAAVCSECRITEHRDHHVEDLEDAINWTKNELQDGMVSADRDAVTEKRRALEIILSDRKRRAIQMAEETFVDAMASLDLVTLDIESEFDENDSLIQERLKILHVFRPLLVCDDNCPLADTLKLFVGRVVTDQQIQAAELPEVVVQREFRCFEDEHEDVHAICPREDGRVWVAHGYTVTGDEAEGWVGLHTNHGAIERRETVTGRVGITRISNSMVIVEGRSFKTKSMTPEETTEWNYAGAELLYRVYSKFQARQDSRVFTPRDVCFFELGGREWLVVADWQGDSLHVLEVSLGGCTFLGHLGAGSPWIVKPSALTADDTGRLWVGCRFGHVLTVKPRN